MTLYVWALEWYGALSQRNTVLCCQPGSSWSKVAIICFKNKVITSPSVVEWVRVNHTLPSVSRADIMESLGCIVLSRMLPLPLLLAHIFLVKLVSFSQVSSIFMILFPPSISRIYSMAYYCLCTSTLIELAWGFSFFDLMYLYPSSFLNTFRTSDLLTSTPLESFTAWHID